MNKKRFEDYQEWLISRLQNEEYAMAYLNEALQDEDPRLFLLALKNVIEAQKIAKAKLAKKSKITRTSTYRILSKTGNPKWTNIRSLLDAAGLHLSVHSSKHR